jgi:peroxiredoxin
MRFSKPAILLLSMTLAACGMLDNLYPSGKDKRGSSAQLSPGDAAPEFSLADIEGNIHTLSGELKGRRGAVIYFTMWCPICDSHMQSILHGPLPRNLDVAFLVVDYITLTAEEAKNTATAGGVAQSPFVILVDTLGDMRPAYGATMGTTVVVDRAGVIRMIEDYKTEALEKALAGL